MEQPSTEKSLLGETIDPSTTSASRAQKGIRRHLWSIEDDIFIGKTRDLIE
jgi:hypothetical protein